MAIQTTPIPFHKVKSLPHVLDRYSNRESALLPYITDFPDLQSIEKQIGIKSAVYSLEQRQLLVDAMKKQTGAFATPSQVENLEKLSQPNAFSVSCGHQLNLAGGPVYMLYKILTVIKLSDQLNQQFPQFQFVPVHWLASEDHDLDEVKSVSFFGQKLDFEVNQTGAVGRMKVGNLAEQMEAIKDFPAWMADAYRGDVNLSEATRNWLQTVFGERGLLVLDADDRGLKQSFSHLALRELLEPWVEKQVITQTEKLEKTGLKSQIFPRPINLFYLTDSERLRLEEKDGRIQTVEGKYSWTKDEAIAHFRLYPEELSPNGVFRPLYSQVLLPDIAFIGGPAEVAYWLQLGLVFAEARIPMPLLLPRFSAVYVNIGLVKKMEKLGLKPEDLLKEDHELKKEASGISTETELPNLEKVYSDLLAFAQKVDPTLVPMTKGELTKIEKMVESIQKRIVKTAEQKNEQQIIQILTLVRKLFPEGSLQERSESWLTFLANDPAWPDKVYEVIEPLDLQFQIMLDVSE